MNEPRVINVILNTNRRENTLACLASLAQSTYSNQHTILLDNASSDGSVEAVQANYPRVEILRLSENKGYAGNNNVGITAALRQNADWIFVLNEDIILDPACHTNLVSAASCDPLTGIAGPMVYHFDEPTIIQSAGGRLDRQWRSIHIGQNEQERGHFDQVHSVDWISGCAILVRREVIDRVGMLDERFFYYWEETEWCLRARKDGWKVVHVPQAKIWHKGVQRNYRPSPDVTYYATRNQLLMMAKHRAPWSVWLATYYSTLKTLVSWTVQPKWKEMKKHRAALWQGMLDFTARQYGKRP